MTGHGVDDFGQPEYSAVGYGFDDHQPNAMADGDQVMSPTRSASRISGGNADAQLETSTTPGQEAEGEQMADTEMDNAMRSGVEKDIVMNDAPRKPPAL